MLSILTSQDNTTQHTIAINVKKKEIHDCEEKGVLSLTMDIDRFCGFNIKIKKFHLWVMLKQNKYLKQIIFISLFFHLALCVPHLSTYSPFVCMITPITSHLS